MLIKYLDHVERFLQRGIARNLEIEHAAAAEDELSFGHQFIGLTDSQQVLEKTRRAERRTAWLSPLSRAHWGGS